MSEPSFHTSAALAAAQAAQLSAENIADALKVTERRYRRLFETARDGILILDSSTGKITDANPYMAEMLGYSHEEFLGKELWEIGLLRDKETSQQAFQVLLQDHYIRYEDLPLETRRGERREVEFVSNLYRENGHSVIQCNIRDITDRKAEQRKAEQQAVLLSAIVEGSHDAIKSKNLDGIVISWNHGAELMYGYTASEMIGQPIARVLPPDRPHEIDEMLKHIALGESVESFETIRQAKDGTLKNVSLTMSPIRDSTGQVIGASTIAHNITDRKANETLLAVAAVKNERIAETLQRSMLQESPAGKFPGLAVETLYVAALNESDVGGDFFDAFACGDARIALVVGDVSGKGLGAAARTSEVKYALRAFLQEYEAPELALSHLNDFICETHRLDTDNMEAFIVLALAVINTTTGETRFSAAGAEPTLILRTDGTVEPVEITGVPLGIQPQAVYAAQARRLASGETVLMTTDGITEARCGPAFLGTTGLRALAEKAGPIISLQELSQVIYGGARDFADGALHDDVCLLLARRWWAVTL